mmetsp:Transcript_21714/g.60335  ORF Transcript_21714/g.60335 Transcript_21714/m.60335 type:complete len:227 (+) Transcript_21714:1844-2524(+)
MTAQTQWNATVGQSHLTQRLENFSRSCFHVHRHRSLRILRGTVPCSHRTERCRSCITTTTTTTGIAPRHGRWRRYHLLENPVLNGFHRRRLARLGERQIIEKVPVNLGGKDVIGMMHRLLDKGLVQLPKPGRNQQHKAQDAVGLGIVSIVFVQDLVNVKGGPQTIFGRGGGNEFAAIAKNDLSGLPCCCCWCTIRRILVRTTTTTRHPRRSNGRRQQQGRKPGMQG